MSDHGADIRRVLGGPAAAAALVGLDAQRNGGAEPDPRPVYRLLGREGLLAPCWPTRYGGRGAPAPVAAELVGALVAAGVPETLHTLSVQICGNFLRTAGSPAQRAAILPALAAGARYCTVLYSEPEVGSDLAALDTRAEPADGGGWLLTGRKVYSVRTDLADLGLVAARTGDGGNRYQRITLLLVDLGGPGVAVRSLASIAEEDFADVRFTAAPVPAGAVVGPVGGAWPLITGALALERVGTDHVAKARRWLAAGLAARPVGPAPDRAARAGALRTRTAAAAALADRCVTQGAALDPVRAAATKLWCSETARDVAWWATECAAGSAVLDAAYREAPGLTISAGTSEMMLELVAASGLADPDRDPEDDDPVGARLRAAARAVCTGGDWWAGLAGLGAFGLAVPARFGGDELGLTATLAVCDEAGRELLDDGLLTTWTVADAAATAADATPDADAADRAGDAAESPGGGAVPLAELLAGRWRAGAGDAVAWDAGPVLARADGTRLPLAGDATRLRAADRYRRAAWLGGLAAGALAWTVRRVARRQQFGRAVGDNQSVQFTLARLAVRYQALRALLDAEPLDPALAAGALAMAGELALDTTRTAVQLHGAYGMTAGSPVAPYYLRAPVAVAADLPPAALYALAGDPAPEPAPAGRPATGPTGTGPVPPVAAAAGPGGLTAGVGAP